MCCENERSETKERDDACGSSRRRPGSACSCGCPQKAKWVCLAGFAAGLGLVAFQALRRSTAAS